MRVFIGAALGFVFLGVAVAEPTDPQEIFNEAIRLDLGDDAGAGEAFALFRRAADQGFAPAEFNVAVMLDSGRGVAPDQQQAALWYARSASHGDHRAAFNLGQLYEAGQGVPVNRSLARAWFEHSALPAARTRAADLHVATRQDLPLTAPLCAEPARDSRLRLQSAGMELVWVSGEQPVPVRFFVEVRDDAGQDVYSDYTAISSALVPLPRKTGKFSWRVSTVAVTQGRYLACNWSAFSLLSD